MIKAKLIYLKMLLLLGANIFVMNQTQNASLLGICIIVYSLGLWVDNYRRTIARIKLFLFLWLGLTLFQVLFNRNSFQIVESIDRSSRSVLQIAIISEIFYVFARRVSMSSVLQAFSFMPNALRILLTITFSSIPFLIIEQSKIGHAQKSRACGITFKSRLIMPIAILVPLTHKVIQRSQQLAYAISMRGYSSNK